MFNKVIIVGNLTRDVELRYLPSGSAVATLGLASNRRYNKQDGTKAEEVCFVDVKLFGRSAEVANQYLRRGSKVLIEGRLSFESWVDQSGQKRSKHSVVAESMQMMDSKPQNSDNYGNAEYESNQSYQQAPRAPQQAYNTQAPQSQPNNAYSQNIPEINIDDEDIPF
ncbi:single-stranded DNA-binding protein [Helicobacter sp. MIT 00-7814]|uniref:single-stranded DNA-binding protein n=1 Tax=unclassified Helicobacter TaxID=2593540 RepID=UPI000E1F04E0|nr:MULTISPECIES: single-stranded DNA-binding protein [unclassified Helicobacter]RDU55284.1 single-stranded DNA-binding protein [Helicobacter sp. MIT 99-10781]RDU56122.1 single-stranded DNA-binding protein [Helicobacter sp. MIT 00-7814]